jgi:hypothetical protein
MERTWQAAMDAPLETFAGWHFMVGCTTCRVLVQQAVTPMRGKHADLPVVAIVARLRCRRCGEWPT